MVKGNPDAGRITKVSGLVSKVTDTEHDTNGNLRLKVYIANAVITEGTVEKDPTEKDFAVGVQKGKKDEGVLSRDLLGLLPESKLEDGGVNFDLLVGKFIEFGYVYTSYLKDGEIAEWSYPRLLTVGEKEETVPPFSREQVIEALRGLTPAEGVRLSNKSGIRGTELAEIASSKNKVLTELGLSFENGRYV